MRKRTPPYLKLVKTSRSKRAARHEPQAKPPAEAPEPPESCRRRLLMFGEASGRN
jgi:hypothetical protein